MARKKETVVVYTSDRSLVSELYEHLNKYYGNRCISLTKNGLYYEGKEIDELWDLLFEYLSSKFSKVSILGCADDSIHNQYKRYMDDEGITYYEWSLADDKQFLIDASIDVDAWSLPFHPE